MFITSLNINKDIVVIAIELGTTSPSFYVVEHKVIINFDFKGKKPLWFMKKIIMVWHFA